MALKGGTVFLVHYKEFQELCPLNEKSRGHFIMCTQERKAISMATSKCDDSQLPCPTIFFVQSRHCVQLSGLCMA